MERLVCLCSIHHRLTHQGRLAVCFDAAGNLVIEREDGRRTVTARRSRAPHGGRAGESPRADAAQPGVLAGAIGVEPAVEPPRGAPAVALTTDSRVDPPSRVHLHPA